MHIPVLLDEAMEYLAVRPGGTYADLTLGLGGHAARILDKAGEHGMLVGFDKDMEAVSRAKENLKGRPGRLKLINADFADAAMLIREAGVHSLDGFLMDLGVSTMQLKTPGRGFGFMEDAPLDMRMDQGRGRTAAQLVNTLDEHELSSLIFRYGEERWAKAIARAIIRARQDAPVETTGRLASLVMDAVPRKAWPKRTHPATRTFQALRIAVNEELGALSGALGPMLSLLKPGGRAVVISYHSLEDRIVKQTFRDWARGCTCPPDFPRCVCGGRPGIKVLTARPVTASDEEVAANPSARSAKLRAAVRL